ncbi:MAG: hypothetical protein A2287_04050 [Candidatus Melainabacteria bacterium RIFOXYA12_FULL_32_12]|nr:MAG: hypothetical protein A2287_04050 [Candidatus Melainabacteria bacterium RIFOXYA12_FULL_32_12]
MAEKDYLKELKGSRNSKNRQTILEVLKLFEVPATAEDIHRMLKYMKLSTSLSTVYRALETFTSNDIAIKSVMMDDNKARYELNRSIDKHYIICMKCDKIFPFNFCPMDNIDKSLLEATNFDIKGHKFEIYGYCPECKK